MRVKTEEYLGNLDQHRERLLEQRGGRLAYGFFRIRRRLGLTSAEEQTREELIAYHERLREDPVGIVWPEDNMTEQEKDAWRLLGKDA